MKTRYNIYFAGQILDGHKVEGVRTALGKVFKADNATLDKLFSGKAQLLKRDCDKATALKYKQALEGAGAQAIIKTGTTEAVTTAADKIAALAGAPDTGGYNTTDTQNHSAPTAVNDEGLKDGADARLNLAPAGTDVLREEERSSPVIREFDTSLLTLDTAAQRTSKEPAQAPVPPDTSHFGMSDVGELIPNLPSTEKHLSPNTDALQLSPEGTTFSDCAAPEAEEPDLDLSAIALAPAGSAVLEPKYRRQQPAEPPTIDHITLND